MSKQSNNNVANQPSSVFQRLITINTIVIALVLLLICGFIFTKEYYSTISRQINSLSSLGEIISDRLTGVMAFKDYELAEKNILTLKKSQDILAACLYDETKKLLTSFENHDKSKLCQETDHHQTELMTNEQIILDGESLGELVLYSNPQLVRNQMISSLVYLIGVAIVCFVLSFLLAKRFIRKETQPIVDLANMARTISSTGDYDLRAQKGYTPAHEISNLVDSFNGLLDIVARHNSQLESLISERTDELEEEKQKVEDISQAKSEFLAKLSHDLRTPLTSILGYAEILNADDILKEKRGTQLDAIIRNADFITQLVNNLLELSKLDSTNLSFDIRPFSIDGLLNNLENTFLPIANAKSIDWDITKGRYKSQWLVGDEVKLQQILNNLLDNAFKFTESGHVNLEFTQEKEYNNLILNKFIISDTGIGISEDQLDRIYDDYVQLEQNAYSIKGGAGLGLAITKKLVVLMGGNLDVSSKVDKGTTFTVELPLNRTESLSIDEQSESQFEMISPEVSLSQSPVLILDDDPGCREILFDIICSFESTEHIYQAQTLKQADQVLQAVNPKLLFLDIELPDGSGLDLAKKIKEHDDTIIIVAVSAFNDEKQEISNELINAFVAKPFNRNDITSTLADLNILQPER